ncbi:hypothetical protein ACFSTH_00190 [Paenibacillus yanchengensis]|uniref:Uncharacterized protein n=1 Tax=Paenibacillus yanchengensis TaxID=2035833 RepID=A0ABW4YEQ6_9BACL
MQQIQLWDRLFKEKKIPKSYTLGEVDNFLKSKYKAISVDKGQFDDLQLDPAVNFNKIVACYKINDPEILQSIFTESELQMHQDSNQKNVSSNFELNSNFKMWVDVQGGRLINVVIESDNGTTMSAFTMQGLSEKLLYELVIMKGIDPEICHIGNETYETYLTFLHRVGYLS